MKKWLKVVGSLAGAALLATLVAGVVFAQGPVDDGDGICDTHGVAPGEGTARGYGRGFRTDDNAQGTPMTGRGGFGRRATGE